jgi:E3 ubiquitin-protein ligase UBR1
MLKIATLISQIDLGVTVRRVHDYFREQIAAVVVEWLLDLTQSRLMSDNIVIREIIGSELLAQRKKDSSSLTTSPEASKVYAEIKDPARMDWLFLYHTRLWKKPRLSLKQVYLSVLTLSHEHKLAVGENFEFCLSYSIDLE